MVISFEHLITIRKISTPVNNARRACARGLQYSLCACVCVCVGVSVSAISGSIKRLYNTLITAIGFVLNAKEFQLTDFSEKASFKSYSAFAHLTTW